MAQPTMHPEGVKETVGEFCQRNGIKKMKTKEALDTFFVVNNEFREKFEALAATLDEDESLCAWLGLMIRSIKSMTEHLSILEKDNIVKK